MMIMKKFNKIFKKKLNTFIYTWEFRRVFKRALENVENIFLENVENIFSWKR